MTDSEARKIRSAFSNGYHYPFGGGYEERCDRDEVNRHAKLLNDALEKQIPQKPIKNRKETIRYTGVYSCPNCRQSFTATGVADYCYHCGQRLDWSEFDEFLSGAELKEESEEKE